MIKYKNMRLGNFIFITILILLPAGINASQSSGTIESGNKNTLVCHSVDCISPTPGVINFAPTGTTPVTIDDINGIDGVAWGNEIGWINLDPTGSEGLIIEPTTGIISGKAWSQVSGWINFSVTGQSVKINNNGEFEGYAWTGGPYGGWLKFDCSFANACLKTDWRPISARTTSPGSGSPTGGSGGSTSQNNISNLGINDFCLNIPGYQNRIPSGYTQDQGGLCLLNIDYCKNLEGVQLTIPSTHVLNGSGQCILLTNENEDEFILGKNKIVSRTLEESIIDYCPNLFGLQARLPDGFAKNIVDCFPSQMDYCPNFLGNQYVIPDDMKINNSGECVKMTKSEIIENNSNILLEKNDKIRVLSYVFIPDFLVIPVVFPFIKSAFIIGNFQIDLISFLITILLITLLTFMIKKRLKTFVFKA